jgi:hypothetical protein
MVCLSMLQLQMQVIRNWSKITWPDTPQRAETIAIVLIFDPTHQHGRIAEIPRLPPLHFTAERAI